MVEKMRASKNLISSVAKREIEQYSYNSIIARKFHITNDLIQRIGLEKELEGHIGCVNCLEWNEKGTLLLSGSDDLSVILWDPFRYKKLLELATGHHGNIFSVKFMPSSNDSVIVTCAADYRIQVHDLNSQDTTQVFSCHANRVKRLAVAPNVPFMFWSAAEDGTVMQFDLRAPETCTGPNPQNVLINLNAHLETHAEVKCLAINPQRPEMLAVGANDPYVRLYDRRMLSCKSIKFPIDSNGSRASSVEKHRIMAMLTDEEEFAIPREAVQYYVAGHLPQKQAEFKKRFRTLASTYVTFGPDGNSLLSNLGGEQIYLFDINKRRMAQKYNAPLLKASSHDPVGHSPSSNGYTVHNTSKHPCESDETSESKAKRRRHRLKYEGKQLPPNVELLKQKAGILFENQKYSSAIELYNMAINMAPNMAILHGNRAAAYMKRAWDGDMYAALRDCYSAIAADSNHLKAHFRLARCLQELGWTMEAKECLELFMQKFPEYSSNPACVTLDAEISLAIAKKLEEDEKNREKPKEERNGGSRSSSFQLHVSDSERVWRELANDYELRYCGHCNTTTDIKEANFFGADGQYIVAGSDDGSFFVWDRHTTNIVRILRGDDSIVNCLQPHPTTCLLATSGIDPVVRLWSPRPEDGRREERLVDNCDDAASANQKRMNADPLEVMLMNMGYRLTRDLEDGDDDDRGDTTPCRPS